MFDRGYAVVWKNDRLAHSESRRLEYGPEGARVLVLGKYDCPSTGLRCSFLDVERPDIQKNADFVIGSHRLDRSISDPEEFVCTAKASTTWTGVSRQENLRVALLPRLYGEVHTADAGYLDANGNRVRPEPRCSERNDECTTESGLPAAPQSQLISNGIHSLPTRTWTEIDCSFSFFQCRPGTATPERFREITQKSVPFWSIPQSEKNVPKNQVRVAARDGSEQYDRPTRIAPSSTRQRGRARKR